MAGERVHLATLLAGGLSLGHTRYCEILAVRSGGWAQLLAHSRSQEQKGIPVAAAAARRIPCHHEVQPFTACLTVSELLLIRAAI